MTFKYDPFGRRIYKQSPNATSIFLYDADNLTETVNSVGGPVARYTQGRNIDEPLAVSQSGSVDYYEQDGLGSVTSLTATNATVAQTYTYDSFGNTTNSSGSLTNFFRYTGRELDTETGLYYYRARYYDTSSGRFVNEDPIRFRAGVDFYDYVSNNPALLNDPSGKSAFGKCLVACIKIHYGLTATGAGMAAAGLPLIPKSVTIAGTSGGTSVASVGLRTLLPVELPEPVWAPTLANLGAESAVLGGVLGRWVPVVGWALLAIDVADIGVCTNQCMNDNWFPCESGK